MLKSTLGNILADLFLAEAVTQAYFFTMLETGISLVAVNLPSLWLLLKSVTLQSIIRGLRSMLSLHSLRSSGSGDIETRDVRVTKDSPNQWLKSRSPTAPADGAGDHRRYDVEAQGNERLAAGIEEAMERDSLDMGIHMSRVESIGIE